MSHMTNAVRKMLDEYINGISDKDLERFVRFPFTSTGYVGKEYDFGSDDFRLVFIGTSTDKPTDGWFMVELRANIASENAAVNALAQNSKKLKQNQRRFALFMYSGPVMEWMSAQHVRMALKASPVWEAGVINKVHVNWDKRLRWAKIEGRETAVPIPAPGMVPSDMYTYDRVPFDGFNVDGTEVSKSGKQEKKKPAGGKK